MSTRSGPLERGSMPMSARSVSLELGSVPMSARSVSLERGSVSLERGSVSLKRSVGHCVRQSAAAGASYKAEHVVDMETGAVLAAEIYAANTGDASTITPSLEKAREHRGRHAEQDHGTGPRCRRRSPPAATSGRTDGQRGRRGLG
ncbi:MAG: hypothetical protein QM820_06885 [Minicystis sp.]